MVKNLAQNITQDMVKKSPDFQPKNLAQKFAENLVRNFTKQFVHRMHFS